jgi:hypothetical protein
VTVVTTLVAAAIGADTVVPLAAFWIVVPLAMPWALWFATFWTGEPLAMLRTLSFAFTVMAPVFRFPAFSTLTRRTLRRLASPVRTSPLPFTFSRPPLRAWPLLLPDVRVEESPWVADAPFPELCAEALCILPPFEAVDPDVVPSLVLALADVAPEDGVLDGYIGAEEVLPLLPLLVSLARLST